MWLMEARLQIQVSPGRPVAATPEPTLASVKACRLVFHCLHSIDLAQLSTRAARPALAPAKPCLAASRAAQRRPRPARQNRSRLKAKCFRLETAPALRHPGPLSARALQVFAAAKACLAAAPASPRGLGRQRPLTQTKLRLKAKCFQRETALTRRHLAPLSARARRAPSAAKACLAAPRASPPGLRRARPLARNKSRLKAQWIRLVTELALQHLMPLEQISPSIASPRGISRALPKLRDRQVRLRSPWDQRIRPAVLQSARTHLGLNLPARPVGARMGAAQRVTKRLPCRHTQSSGAITSS